MSRFVIGNITMTLDSESIERAIKEVTLLQVTVKRMLDSLCDYLLKEGVSVAKIQLARFGVDDGPLMNSIKQVAYDRQKGVGYITAGEGLIAGNTTNGYPLMSYAIFVEEGFGKPKNQKKTSTAVWKPTLNLGKYSKQITAPADDSKDSWVYLNEKDDHFYVSHGQPPKPFMYNTLLDLQFKARAQSASFIATYLPTIGGGGE